MKTRGQGECALDNNTIDSKKVTWSGIVAAVIVAVLLGSLMLWGAKSLLKANPRREKAVVADVGTTALSLEVNKGGILPIFKPVKDTDFPLVAGLSQKVEMYALLDEKRKSGGAEFIVMGSPGDKIRLKAYLTLMEMVVTKEITVLMKSNKNGVSVARVEVRVQPTVLDKEIMLNIL